MGRILEENEEFLTEAFITFTNIDKKVAGPPLPTEEEKDLPLFYEAVATQ